MLFKKSKNQIPAQYEGYIFKTSCQRNMLFANGITICLVIIIVISGFLIIDKAIAAKLEPHDTMYNSVVNDDPPMSSCIIIESELTKTEYKYSILISVPSMMYDDKSYKIDSSKSKKKDVYYPNMDEFVRVDKQPEMVYQHTAKYPPKLMKQGIEGTVWIKSLIDLVGSTRESVIYKTSGEELFDKSALKASKFNKFKPAIFEGKPVAIWISYRVDFKLE